MARRTLGNRHTRKLIKGSTSYMVTVPIEFIRAMEWRDGQKLTLEFDDKHAEITVRDWKKDDE